MVYRKAFRFVGEISPPGSFSREAKPISYRWTPSRIKSTLPRSLQQAAAILEFRRGADKNGEHADVAAMLTIRIIDSSLAAAAIVSFAPAA
jgi:hypothetical protein